MTATTLPDPGGSLGDGAAALASSACDVAVGDLDELFRAVKGRLRRIVGADFEVAQQARGDVAVTQLRADVLECVSALDQLHTTLAHEIARREQLEQVVLAAQLELARAQPPRAPARQASGRVARLAHFAGFVS